jgi:integration host factor subunit alpha
LHEFVKKRRHVLDRTWFSGQASQSDSREAQVTDQAKQTLTRAQLSEAVYQTVGLSRTESAQLVERVLDEIAASLMRGETVKLSSFGSFAVRQKGGRVGRNPKTGEEVPIEPRRVLVFRPSHVLKDRVNAALGEGERSSS